MIHIVGIFTIVVLLVFGSFMIYKISKHYDALIEANEKNYIEHIDDWYYEILEDNE